MLPSLNTSNLLLAIAVLAGIVAMLPLVRFSQRLPISARRRFWALSLFVAALIYVVVALIVERSMVASQLVGLVIYSAIALLGVWRWPRLLAVGWALHMVWDFLGHPITLDPLAPNPSFMPWWYPPACLGADLFVAGILWYGLAGDEQGGAD